MDSFKKSTKIRLARSSSTGTAHNLTIQDVATIITVIEDVATLPTAMDCVTDCVQNFFLQRSYIDVVYGFDQTVL